MNVERVLADDVIHFFFGIRQRQDDTTGSWYFTSGGDKYILFVVLLQELHMVAHVRVQLFQWNDVVEVDDEHDGKLGKAYRTSRNSFCAIRTFYILAVDIFQIMKRLIFSIAFFSCFTAHAQVESLRKQIQDLVGPVKADIGIAIKILEGDDTLTFHGSRRYPMQSVFKFPLAMAMMGRVDQGKFSLGQKIGLNKSEYFPTHSPLAKKYPEGSADVTLGEMVYATVSVSDNVGCDAMFRLLGGPTVVEDYVRSLGVKDMMIAYNEREMHSDWNIPFKNWSTPYAMLRLLEVFHEGKKLSDASYDFLWKAMVESPSGPKRIRAGIPSEIVVAHKTGTGGRNEQGVLGALNDAAIVVLPDGRHLGIVVFVTKSLEPDGDLEAIMAAVAKAAFEFYSSGKH